LLAEERTRKRTELLAATEEALAPIIAAVNEGRLAGSDKIGLKVGKVINKFKMAKHFEVAIGEATLSLTRREDAIATEAALDGIYVLRTTIKLMTSMRPGSSMPTRHCHMSNATFATSRSTTSTCARSTTAWANACARMSSSACSLPTSSGTCAKNSLR
jgi:hypothetical protein